MKELVLLKPCRQPVMISLLRLVKDGSITPSITNPTVWPPNLQCDVNAWVQVAVWPGPLFSAGFCFKRIPNYDVFWAKLMLKTVSKCIFLPVKD